MPTPIPTYEELLADAQSAVKAKTGITNFSESSIAGALLKAPTAMVMDLYAWMADSERQSDLATAVGAALDRIGQQHGVTRLAAKQATTLGGGSGVLFRNGSGTEVTVPAGTRLWSSLNPSVSYSTVTSLTLAAGTDGYVDVTADGYGQGYNVGPESLTSHDLGNSNVTVTNPLAVSSGQDLESDENYRYRIANAWLTAQGANRTAVRLRLLELPGVRDVTIRDLARGTGTLDAVILPVERTVSTALLSAAQRVLDETVADGISAKAIGPEEVPLELTVRVALKTGLNANSTRALVAQAAAGYIDNLPIDDGRGSGKMIYNELISRVMDAHSDVVNCEIRMTVNGQSTISADIPVEPGQKLYLNSIEVL